MVQSKLVFWGLPSSTPTEILKNRSAIAKLNNKSKSDYTRKPIPIRGLRKIWRKLMQNDQSALLMINPFGGRMVDFSETVIPFPHRAGVLLQILKTASFNGESSDKTPTSLRRIEWMRSLDEILTPYVSNNPREAYSNYNYLDLGVRSANYEEASVWGERYWKRDSFRKLIRIKAKVDPHNFFRHPQSIPVFYYLPSRLKKDPKHVVIPFCQMDLESRNEVDIPLSDVPKQLRRLVFQVVGMQPLL